MFGQPKKPKLPEVAKPKTGLGSLRARLGKLKKPAAPTPGGMAPAIPKIPSPKI